MGLVFEADGMIILKWEQGNRLGGCELGFCVLGREEVLVAVLGLTKRRAIS
jgi:hypothetical protein